MKRQFLLAVLFLTQTGPAAAQSRAKLKPQASAQSQTLDETQELSLEQFLGQVQAKNGLVQSLKSSRKAAENKRVQGDLELSPILSLRAAQIKDKKLQIQGTSLVDQLDTKDYTMSLGKKFSTGTQAQVSFGVNELTFQGSNLGTTPPAAINQSFSTGYLGLSVSQSLWKDFFGHGVRLRQEREELIEKTEVNAVTLQEAQVLIEAEAGFWEHLYLLAELDQRKLSLDRAQKIEGWVKRRASNGIGDKADVYNSQGLVALRELQMLAAQDELLASQARIRKLLALGPSESLPKFKGSFDQERSPKQFLSGSKDSPRVIRLDVFLSGLEADVQSVVAREVEDGLRPDLVVEGSYKTNSFETSLSEAANRVTDQSRPTTQVGLRFSVPLDFSVTGAAKDSARFQALAAQQKRDQKYKESELDWKEFERRHSELAKKIKAAEKASRFQNLKSASERDKLSKGRSVTSQVIQAEQEASESLLTLARFQVEQRKMEAQAQLFIGVAE